MSRPPDDIVPTERNWAEPAERAAYYRETAAFIRSQLSPAMSAEAREQLGALAADYERLATHVEDAADKTASD